MALPALRVLPLWHFFRRTLSSKRALRQMRLHNSSHSTQKRSTPDEGPDPGLVFTLFGCPIWTIVLCDEGVLYSLSKDHEAGMRPDGCNSRMGGKTQLDEATKE